MAALEVRIPPGRPAAVRGAGTTAVPPGYQGQAGTRGGTVTCRMLALAVAVLLGWAAPAAAKGPSDGRLTGEGLDQPVTLAGEGTEVGQRLLDQLGWFPAMYRRQ